MGQKITSQLLDNYEIMLIERELSDLTVRKYMLDIRQFCEFLPPEKEVTKEIVMSYKEHLRQHYQISSVNSKLVAVNGFLKFAGWESCRVRQFKVQRSFFRRTEDFLTKKEYEALVAQAEKEDVQLSRIMQTICSTGIRVGELKYIDVKAVKAGYAQIHNKGKIRIVFFPGSLVHLLEQHCRENGITKGPVFLTSRGKPVDRSVIWRKMKKAGEKVKIDKKKIFPHNLRHLFATTFYRFKKDLLRLAEVLGHTNIETTRIYTATTGKEHRRTLSKLGLVCRYKKST